MSVEKSIEMSFIVDIGHDDSEDLEETDNVGRRLLQDEESRDQNPGSHGPQAWDNESQMTGWDQAIHGEIEETSETISMSDSLSSADAIEYLTKSRRYRKQRRLNTALLYAIENNNVEDVTRFLGYGANANATCKLDLISACHLAALAQADCVTLLVQSEAQKLRRDILGRTPLHIAAFVGNTRQLAFLLGFSKDTVNRLEIQGTSVITKEIVKNIPPATSKMVNIVCDPQKMEMKLPKNWEVDIDYKCKDIKVEPIQPGWTPLHAAAAASKPDCARLLLAVGADPNIIDYERKTALDVAGSEYYYTKDINPDNFTEVIKILLAAGGTHNTMKLNGINDVNTPLHTAVELDNEKAIQALLDSEVSVACRNVDGLTPMHICVKKELDTTLFNLAAYIEKSGLKSGGHIDVRDRKGHTVLQAAVEEVWISGVCKALESGADVTVKADDDETLLHMAASTGPVEVLKEILTDIRVKDFINCRNKEGETPLFKAIQKNRIECVQVLLQEGASVTITLPGDLNVLHVASQCGHQQILQFLLAFDVEATKNMIQALSADEKGGYGPIHYAVKNNHKGCVEELLSYSKANVMLKTRLKSHHGTTPLHIAAEYDLDKIAEIIINLNKETIRQFNNVGWYPLHTAAHHGNEKVIFMLLKNGADLSCYTEAPRRTRRSAVEMIVNNMIKPTQFLTNIFDSCISSNEKQIRDTDCEITIDYRILTGNSEKNKKDDMKVIEDLVDTGNRYDQRQLLLHPLVESFLYLKWKALLPFFYAIVAINSLFVISFTIFIISVFFYKDNDEPAPIFLDKDFWGCLAYVMITLILLQEYMYIGGNGKKYILSLEKWVKIFSVILASASLVAIHLFLYVTEDWVRHMATLALLLSWLMLMFLLSRFPIWGYYVLMFEKVTENVMKILLTFTFLIIGFSLSFMVQFHSKVPFENPWNAFIKTLVMMTSEFDYMGLFNPENKDKLPPSLIITRLFFFSFLILAAVVLMNLLVGVAVKNITNLEMIGNIHRLAKQIEFLATLDKLVDTKHFGKMLPNKLCDIIMNKRSVPRNITLHPGWPQNTTLDPEFPSEIQEAIIMKVVTRKKLELNKTNMVTYNKKIDAIHKAVVNEKNREEDSNNLDKVQNNTYNFTKCILNAGLNDDDTESTSVTNEIRDVVAAINCKVDIIMQDIEVMKLGFS